MDFIADYRRAQGQKMKAYLSDTNTNCSWNNSYSTNTLACRQSISRQRQSKIHRRHLDCCSGNNYRRGRRGLRGQFDISNYNVRRLACIDKALL